MSAGSGLRRNVLNDEMWERNCLAGIAKKERLREHRLWEVANRWRLLAHAKAGVAEVDRDLRARRRELARIQEVLRCAP